MSRSVNKIILVGQVGRDPEVCETQSGTKVAHLSVATNHRMGTGTDSERERTDWHRLTLWNKLTLFVEEFVQGDRIYVEGRLEYDTYERDGVTIPTAEINVREVLLPSPRRETEAERAPGSLVSRPEARQGVTVGALAELLERSVPDLANALPGHAQQGADFLQRALLPVVEAVV